MSQPAFPRPRSTDPTEHHPDDDPITAKSQTRDVAAHGREQAKGVADTAREGVSQVAEETSRQTRRLVDETLGQLRAQAGQETQRVGGALHSLGERLDALADGEPDKAGPLGEYAEQFASQTHEIARKIDELGFDGVVRELSSFARRRPGAFLLSTAVAGFASARLGRGVAESEGASRPSAPDSAQRPSVSAASVTHDDLPSAALPATESGGAAMHGAATTRPPSTTPAPDREIRR